MTPDHDTEHQFVRILMQERAEKKQRWDKIKNSALGWLTIKILFVVGYVGYRILAYIAPQWLKDWLGIQ